jgi:hypothetical protein
MMWVEGSKLKTSNGKEFEIGIFSTKSVGELRRMAESCCLNRGSKMLKVDFVYGDVQLLHIAEEYKHATFQTASQFNCLEFISPGMTPEAGITIYEDDKTQGPACRCFRTAFSDSLKFRT